MDPVPPTPTAILYRPNGSLFGCMLQVPPHLRVHAHPQPCISASRRLLCHTSRVKPSATDGRPALAVGRAWGSNWAPSGGRSAGFAQIGHRGPPWAVWVPKSMLYAVPPPPPPHPNLVHRGARRCLNPPPRSPVCPRVLRSLAATALHVACDCIISAHGLLLGFSLRLMQTGCF